MGKFSDKYDLNKVSSGFCKDKHNTWFGGFVSVGKNFSEFFIDNTKLLNGAPVFTFPVIFLANKDINKLFLSAVMEFLL